MSTSCAISRSASSATSTTSCRVSTLPINVKSRSTGESGMWKWALSVAFPTSDSESLVSGRLGGDAGILAPWLTVSLAGANDTARRAAVTTGALKECMSIKVSANNLRIVALALQLGLTTRL